MLLLLHQPGKYGHGLPYRGLGFQLGGDTLTPTMVTTISINAPIQPTPTANIRARYKAQGIDLPPWCLPVPITQWGITRFVLEGPTAASICAIRHNADFGIGMRAVPAIRLRDGDTE